MDDHDFDRALIAAFFDLAARKGWRSASVAGAARAAWLRGEFQPCFVPHLTEPAESAGVWEPPAAARLPQSGAPADAGRLCRAGRGVFNFEVD